MKYCTVDDIYEKQKDLTFEGGGKCRVLVDGAELDICKVMPDNIVLHFENFCDGCDVFDMDFYRHAIDEGEDGNPRLRHVVCRHMPACKDIYRRFIENAE